MENSAVATGLEKVSFHSNPQKRQRRKGKMYPFEFRVQRIARRDKKAFLSDQCKEREENNFMQRWAQ